MLKHKTTAMIADDLKAHHRRLFWSNVLQWSVIAAAGIIVAWVVS